jgi:acyl carrier protein
VLTEAEILAGLKDILARIAGVDPAGIELDALIIDDVGVDSLGFYEILIEADETMGIKIEEKDLLTFTTVRDIVDYVTARALTATQPAPR